MLLYIWMLKGERSGCGSGEWEWFRYRKSGVSRGVQGRRADGSGERA
jgi:hypothetical protein